MSEIFYSERSKRLFNDSDLILLTDIESLLNLARQMKIPSYKSWKNMCSVGSLRTENEAIDVINKTLYRYYIVNEIYLNFVHGIEQFYESRVRYFILIY